MSAWGRVTDLVLLTLADLGRVSAGVVAEAADLDVKTVSKTLQRLAAGPVTDRRVHVVAWTYDCDGQRRYPRPVYRAGSGQNRQRPARPDRRVQHADTQRRLKQRYQQLLEPIHGPMNQKRAARLGAEMRRRGLL